MLDRHAAACRLHCGAPPAARRKRLHLADLAAIPPFFRFRRGADASLYDRLSRQYAAFGFTPQAMEAMGVFAQIAAGRGCTIMPEALLRQRRESMAGRPLGEDVTIDLALALSQRLAPALRDGILQAARQLAEFQRPRASPQGSLANSPRPRSRAPARR